MTHAPGSAPWFEDRYRAIAEGVRPSWADGQANPLMMEWLAASRPPPGRALVVGCGLGDDAAALAAAGLAVTAFDLSPTAVALARSRFPDAGVCWCQGDLLSPPDAWRGGFDLVVEIYTLQAMPPDRVAAAMAVLATLPTAGGVLFVLCRGRDDDESAAGPPWPLSVGMLGAFDRAGLRRVRFEDFSDPFETLPVRRFRGLWRR